MKSRNKGLLAIAALVAAGSLAPSARGSLTINLRFADGSTQRTLTSADVGHDVEIDVWGTITGHNAPSSHNFFALQYVYYAISSSLPDGTSAGVGGGLASGTTPDGNTNVRVSPFDAIGGQVGTLQDFNGDGAADLGPISSTGLTDYAKSRSFPATWSDFNLPTEHLLPNGCEFELEKLYFHVNSLSGQETDYIPVSATLSPPYAPANWAFDVPSYTYGAPIGAQYTQATPAFAGSEVQLLVSQSSPSSAVPEPTTCALALGLAFLPLGRARKHRTI
jgi:hypothetical protein